MRKFTAGSIAASGALAAVTILGGAGVAAAQQDEGPVRFSAEGNDQCEVTFTIENETNSRYYTIDFMVDDEFTYWQEDSHYSVTRFALSSDAETPLFPEDTNSYAADRDPVTSERTIDLRDLYNRPNPDADEHTISYRMIRGPVTAHRDDESVYTTEVSGCADDGADEDSGQGSLGGVLGSVDVFGSLGS